VSSVQPEPSWQAEVQRRVRRHREGTAVHAGRPSSAGAGEATPVRPAVPVVLTAQRWLLEYGVLAIAGFVIVVAAVLWLHVLNGYRSGLVLVVGGLLLAGAALGTLGLGLALARRP
jgi:hypothetical protein